MNPPPALDVPLPPELAGRSQGWFTQYRRWPVFSPAWVRGRWRVVGTVIGAVAGMLLLSVLGVAPKDRPWLGLVETVLVLLGPALLGPWLCSRVRRRGWPARVEGRALAGAIAAVVIGATGYHLFLSEPLKQWIAEQTGDVDAQGKRRRVAMLIGVTVKSAEEEALKVPGSADTNEPVSLTVNALTRALVAFLLGGGLGLVTWRREQAGLAALAREQALRRAEAQRREAEMKLSVLAAQVEPHFLFNTLAGVRSAIATDPARASEMIDRLVEYLRAAIPRLRQDGVEQATVGAQFELVRAYLGLMKARMPRLDYSIEAPADLLRARCPPLMLISLAENAVKHGVEPKIGPARVEVSAARAADGRLQLTVADDGVGFGEGTAGSGIGLANIRERLAQLHGEAAALTLKAREGGGVAATITLPLETAA